MFATWPGLVDSRTRSKLVTTPWQDRRFPAWRIALLDLRADSLIAQGPIADTASDADAMLALAAKQKDRGLTVLAQTRQVVAAMRLGQVKAATTQPQEPVRQDAAFQIRLELVFDELRQTRPGVRLDLCEESLERFCHHPIERRFLRAVALVRIARRLANPHRRQCGALHCGSNDRNKSGEVDA